MTAQHLARHFGTIERFDRGEARRTSRSTEGIGPERAEPVAEWFAEDDNRRADPGARVRSASRGGRARREALGGPLRGRQYVITGTLEGYTREEARAALEALGAKVSDRVSKKTAGVIAGESPGSKARSREGGVPVLTEADLRGAVAP